MTTKIDINCDLGEGFGVYRFVEDAEIMNNITSCNIACGFHAGDPSVIVKTIQTALIKNIRIGAHPSYADLQGFGRREIYISPNETFEIILYQVSALNGMTKALGGKLNHVKLHGALYNFTAASYDHCQAAFNAVKLINPELLIYGLPNTYHQQVAQELGFNFLREGFADRKYHSDGKLLPRNSFGSVIEDSDLVANQSFNMVENQFVNCSTGEKINMEIDTLCFHGDHIQVLENLRKTRNVLKLS